MAGTADRVQDTTSAPGTGAVTVSGTPPTGKQAFSVFATGTVIYYCIQAAASALWEVGQGTMTSGTTFSRDTVLDGSSGPGVLVNFNAGTFDVFCDMPAYAVKRGTWGLKLGQQYFGVLP